MSDYFPPQMVAAGIRSLLGAALLFGLTTMGTYQLNQSWSDAMITGGVAALTNIAMRFGIEGAWDSHRNAIGDVQKGDVGAELPARSF
jgi:hypothetical protein